jgi:glycosyltransferase involved in cell wall biosynthesis
MSESAEISRSFNDLKVCVIMPTYNNAGTLGGVIADVAKYTRHIIVVNDGSTDDTVQIASSFPFVNLIGYPVNAGKGVALRTGFKYAIEKNYEYAITIDSDGQHFATDLPAFITKIKDVPGALIVGSRNMDQASIPGKSSFGHKFSNFWYKIETGIDCPDTQSGFRLYPLFLLKNTKFFTRKYEFEIEVLVRAAWKGIEIDSVPVTVYYAPKETRISHFRPFQDFSRVSVLNTFLVIIAFGYIKPRDLFRTLFIKKKGKELFMGQLMNFNQSNQVKAASVGLGVCMGIMPFWGFQMWVGLFFAAIFRLNKTLVVMASQISIPPMIPLIVFLSYKTGEYWMGSKTVHISFSKHITLSLVRQHLEQYIFGSVTLAIICGLLTYGLFRSFTKKTVAALSRILSW